MAQQRGPIIYRAGYDYPQTRAFSSSVARYPRYLTFLYACIVRSSSGEMDCMVLLIGPDLGQKTIGKFMFLGQRLDSSGLASMRTLFCLISLGLKFTAWENSGRSSNLLRNDPRIKDRH